MTKLFIVFIYFPVRNIWRAKVNLVLGHWLPAGPSLGRPALNPANWTFFLRALSHLSGDLELKTIFFQLWFYILELRVGLWWYRRLWCCRTCRTGCQRVVSWDLIPVGLSAWNRALLLPRGFPVHQYSNQYSPPCTHTGQAVVAFVGICVVFRVDCQTRW